VARCAEPILEISLSDPSKSAGSAFPGFRGGPADLRFGLNTQGFQLCSQAVDSPPPRLGSTCILIGPPPILVDLPLMVVRPPQFLFFFVLPHHFHKPEERPTVRTVEPAFVFGLLEANIEPGLIQLIIAEIFLSVWLPRIQPSSVLKS